MMMLTLSYSVMTRELGQSTMMLPPFLSHNTLSRIKQFGMQPTMARVEAMMVVMVAMMVVIVEVEAMTVVVVMTAVVVVMAAVVVVMAAVAATVAAVAVVTEHAMLIC